MTENVFTLVHEQNQTSDRMGNAREASLKKKKKRVPSV